MIYNLSENVTDSQINEEIRITKSNSSAMGAALRKAHYYLGQKLSEVYKEYFSENDVVVCIMRAGLPFTYGFIDTLDCTCLFYDDKKDNTFFLDNKEILENKNVIFIDAVINTGKSLLETIKSSGLREENIKIVTNVLCDKAIESFNDYSLFTVRVSSNSFIGSKVKVQKDNKGPDTGDRLFRTL